MNRNLRTLTALCLVATAALSLLWTLLAPEFHSDPAEQLAGLAEAGSRATISEMAFVISQLPFLVAMSGVAVWLHPASPRLATAGGVLAVLGAFGHAVVGGTTTMQVIMADSPDHRQAYAELLGDTMDSPLMLPFFAAGLLGTVLGILLLSIAHFRNRQLPRWVGPALWAFLVLEFVGSNVSEWSAYLAGVLYLAALCALAVAIRSDLVATPWGYPPLAEDESVAAQGRGPE